MRRTRSALRALALAGAVSLAAACGAEHDDPTPLEGRASPDVDCAPFEQYGDLLGQTITVYAGIATPQALPYIDSFAPFETCTGAIVRYEGDTSFATNVLARARSGDVPDLAVVPQPDLLAELVATGAAVPAPPRTAAHVDALWGEGWRAYGTVGGELYAAPLSASVKSLVWYSPREFRDNGYEVPRTLAELARLSDAIAATGRTPWCAGISSGAATGWPVTDWHEDMMLRLHGPQAYDAWVAHELAFDSPESIQALDAVGAVLKDGGQVNGGWGDVASIATTTVEQGGLPILEGTCSLHRQGAFYASAWPAGTDVSPDGDVFAFHLPGTTPAAKPVLGTGEFVLAFDDRPAVQAFQDHLSSAVWADDKAEATPQGGWASANTGMDVSRLARPIDRLAAEVLQDERAVFRFDGSDLMPEAVGSGSYEEQVTRWITGQGTEATVRAVEQAWPQP